MKNLEKNIYMSMLKINDESTKKLINDFYDKDKEILNLDIKIDKVLDFISDEKLVFRKDEVKSSISREDALKNAKNTHYGYFSLKRVVD